MMILEDEVTPFHISPWNALCKNGILLKNIPFFDQTPQHRHFCTSKSLLMFQKSLGYAIKKSEDSIEFQ